MNHQHVSTADLIGRLGQEPELKRTEVGVPYVHLSVATLEHFTNDAGQVLQKKDWHRAVAWGPVAEEIAGAFHKGDLVALSGAMRLNVYEKNGHRNRVTEVHVEKAEPSKDNSLSRNEVRVVGIAREDAKAIDTASGVPLTGISIASRTSINGREREDWHRVSLWGKTAEAARDIKAGDTIAINGSLRHKTFTAPDGKEHRSSTIDGRQFQVLDRALERSIEPRIRRHGKVLDRGI